VTVQILPSGHAEILDIVLPVSNQPSANQLLKFSLRWEALETASNALAQKAPALAQRIVGRLPLVDEAFIPRLLLFVDMGSHQNLELAFGSEVLNMLRALGLDGMLPQDFGQLQQLQ